MAKKKLRSIIVDGAVYRWSFSPGYERTDNPLDPFRCRDVFTAYAENNYASPLRITFSTEENTYTGGHLRTGSTNLHTPKWAAMLIREGLKSGWLANADATPFIMQVGSELIAAMDCESVSA